MSKLTPARVIVGIVAGFLLILIAAWFSGSTGEICKEAKSGHEQCSTYNLAPFILFQIREAIHAIEGVITALATVAIAWFTWTLWQSSEKMWNATKIAADAADRSARAAIGLQLPIIRMRPDKLDHDDAVIDGKPNEECSVSRVLLANLGSMEAFPKEILYGFTVGADLPPQPSYGYTDKFTINFILKPAAGMDTQKRLTFGVPLEAGQWSNILKGNYLWFYCALLYDDSMGEPHSHGFCWRWANVGMGLDWRIDDTPAYNRKT
jgi:hypothetical protein